MTLATLGRRPVPVTHALSRRDPLPTSNALRGVHLIQDHCCSYEPQVAATDVLEVNFDKKHVSGDGLYMIAYPGNDDGCAWGGVRRFCRMPVSGLHIFEGDKWVPLNEGHRDMLVIGQVLNVYRRTQ